jgi:hypothetical protein
VSVTFTKLFASITESTVWCEPDSTRIVWITMLAMSDSKGRVWASIPGLANRARVTVQQVENALITFKSPDHYSRTPDNEGRRVEDIDGGWRLLNHEKYRSIRDEESIKESKRRYINERRKAEKQVENVETEVLHVENVDRGRYNAEAYTEAYTDKTKSTPIVNPVGLTPVDKSKNGLNCPHQKLLDLYHTECKSLAKVARWSEQRKAAMASLWKTVIREEKFTTEQQGLEYFEGYFNWIEQSDFLCGRTGGDRPFLATIDWILKPANFTKIIESNYHRRAA